MALALPAVPVWLVTSAVQPARAGDDDCFEWLRVEPEGRAGHRVAFDTRRNVLVMFGGIHQSRSDVRGDTWEWNGKRWRLAAEDGPSPRSGLDMAYDERRGVVVLFGGRDPDARDYYADTWEWDGHTWTQRNVEGPSPRAYHAMAYDSDRGVTVLTGGMWDDFEFVHDTWEWDGQSWTLRDGEQPATASSHRMVYDRKRRVMVAFGGWALTSVVWEWDGNVWTRRDTVGPSGRLGHSLVYDSRRSVSVLVSGNDLDDEFPRDMWEWDGQQWTQLDPPPFEGRDSAAMAFDPAQDRLVLVGGYGALFGLAARVTSDIWAYSNGAWTQVRGSAPSAYSEAHIVYDARHRVSALVGGSPQRGELHGSVWEWTGKAWRLPIPANPQEFYVNQAAYDPDLRETIIISRDDPIELWSWRRPYWRDYRIENAPSIDDGGVMTYDERRGVAVIVGDGGQTWEWSGRQDRLDLRSNDGPDAPAYSAMTYDSARGVSVFFGGRWQEAGTTWEWDGASWTLASREGPGALSSHTMTYDTRRQRTLLFGGNRQTEGRVNEVWRWNGQHWLELETTGVRSPSPRDSAGFVYDRNRDVFVAYGGRGAGDRSGGELWELTPVVCCDDVEMLTTKCKKTGLVAILELSDDRHDGRRVTLLADGHWRDAKVRGDRARARFAGVKGQVEITMETPSGCDLKWEAECN